MIEYRIPAAWSAYRVGNDGSIWTRWRKGPGATPDGTWRVLKARIDDDGYRRVTLRGTDGSSKSIKVCVLVCEAFNGPRPSGMVCRHDNGNCQDDRADNLLWGTTQENTDDRRRHGTIAAGERHGKCKLSQEKIDALLSLQGTMTQQGAADQFGVSRGYVGQLWSGRRKRVTT